MIKQNKVIIALDTGDFRKALSIISSINFEVIYKLGMEFFYSFGYEGINKIKEIKPNIKIFLDLKLHDIPNTVCKGIIPLIKNIKPFMITLHSTGGSKMLQQVAARVKETFINERPLLIGVTVLTSLDSNAMSELGWNPDINKNVVNYALLCKKSGLDGIVCSALEIERVRGACGKEFQIITPGIRFENNSSNDQARVVTPSYAFKKGTDYIVIGRPVVESKNPKSELEKIFI